MNLFVLGATGKTGSAIVAQALARGHHITTFGRTEPRAGPAQHRRDLVGSPMDEDALAQAMLGHDIVLSVLGTRGLGATSVLQDGARATLEAMRRADVKRLLILSSALLDRRIGVFPAIAASTVLRHHRRDQLAMESLVTKSSVEWIVLRPPRMTDAAKRSRYVLTVGAPTDSRGMSIGGDEVARAMLDIAESGQFVRAIVRLRGVPS